MDPQSENLSLISRRMAGPRHTGAYAQHELVEGKCEEEQRCQQQEGEDREAKLHKFV